MHTIGWCEAGYGSTSVNPDPSGFGHVAVRLDAVYFQFWQERNTLDRYWYLLCAVKNQIEATYKSYLKLRIVSNIYFGILGGRGAQVVQTLGVSHVDRCAAVGDPTLDKCPSTTRYMVLFLEVK